jgi:hypothetical protein
MAALAPKDALIHGGGTHDQIAASIDYQRALSARRSGTAPAAY